MSKKTKLILFTALMTAIVIILQEPTKHSSIPRGSGEAQIGGAFTLTDQTGKRVSSEDLKGRALMIFMGYSNCPDICPATLSVLSDTLKKLGANADKVHAVFISVDSANDTPQKLAEYLQSFDPRLIALTGNKQEVDAIIAAYKGYAKLPENPAPGNNLISHSGWIYLMDKNGKYVRHFDNGVKSGTLVEALQELL